ncbi:hemolysin-III related-domain-containing protein [Aspergillus pseudonomiae]|nr:hemolysin-III related-domain-containing protein [Aspergillus pseudonomiae]
MHHRRMDKGLYSFLVHFTFRVINTEPTITVGKCHYAGINYIPSWQRENQYILSGYWTASNYFRKSFASLAYIHNESVNIYSHLIPAILLLFISLTLHASLTARYTSVSTADTIALGCFVLGAVLCLVISATFHTVQNHSSHVARIANQMDYIGIVFLIVGSFIPSIFYGFYCHHIYKHYLCVITSLGPLCAAISVIPQFPHPTWRSFPLLPVIHGIMKFGIRQMNKQIDLFWVVLQGSLYIVGACIYANQITSRQIFHHMVELAIIMHLHGLINAFDYNHGLMPYIADRRYIVWLTFLYCC